MGERLAASTRAVPRALLPVLLSFLVALVWASSASAAVTQKQAAARAIDALGADQGDSALIVFGLPKPVKAGTQITQAGTTKPSKGTAKGLSKKLRSAGVRLVKAPRVLTVRSRSYLFYEDRGPYQLYQHPGRVALVDAASGKVTVSKTINWPPLLSGKLPAFLKSSNAYRSSKYQVLNRPYEVNGATQQPRPLNRNLFDQDPFGPGKPLPSMTNAKAIADRLAAEHSCALRVTDTLPSFWNANDLNLTRTYVGTLLEALERENGGFVDDRYGARSGETLGKAVDSLVAQGCKDILLYIAGQGYSSGGEPVIHLGTAVRSGGRIAQQNISATDLSKLVSARTGVTFKFKIDAPYSGGMIDRLKGLPNVLLIETPSAAGDEAFAFIPQVENQNGQIVSSNSNPAGLLEFTNCELVGLKAFFDSQQEIDKATQGQNEGVSFLAEMLARAQELCNGQGGFADDLGASPQLYAQKRASGNGTNRPPKADKQDVTVTEDTPKAITLTGSDPDGDSLTFSITKQPDHGTLSGSGPNVTYTPAANYTGPDDFSFKVDDGKGASNTAKVEITVVAGNDPAVVTTSAGSTAYTEDGAAVPVDGSLTVADPDDTQLEGAEVRIHGDDFQTGDELSFVNTPAITGFYDTNTGALFLTGTASVADYQAALRSVRFRTTNDNAKNPKRIEFRADDGDGLGPVATKNMAITNVNDAPAVNASDTALAYTENDGPVAVDPFIAVTDPDSENLSGAVIQITSNFVSAEDELAFTNQNGISGSYNDATGTLTLSGNASLNDYATAIHSVTYENSSENPSTATRTVSFQVTDDGGLTSSVDTRDITITRVNDAPTVNTSAGNTSYTEGASGTTIDGSLTVGDVDDTNLESADVRIAPADFEAGDDLTFVNQNGISGVYNTGTGVLTLSGTASVADYQTALRSITYSNTTDDNLKSPKTISFKVNDGSLDSNTATKNIVVTPVNDNPTLDTSDASLAYTEGDGAVAVDSGITVTDPDSANLVGGTVQITSNFNSAEDDLVFVDQNGISGSYNDATGTLTLTGSATLAQYQAALRSVQYQNTSDNPSSATRTVSFQVDDGGAVDNLSNVATRDITITRVNDAPTVNTSAGNTSYTEGASGTTIDGSLTVGDPDDTNLESATVSISNNFESGDDLTFVNQNGISGVYNTGTGVLTLSGTASVADYQTALRSITYSNTTDDNLTSPKTISFKVNDGDADSNTATKNIIVTPVNDAPTVNTSAGDTAYTENSPAATIDSALTVSDPDDTNLEGGQVRISSGFQSGDDLVFVNQNGISGVYNSGTGVLTLTGTASVAAYQTALRSVQYQTTSENPSSPKTVEFKVNDGDADSNLATKNVVVTPANDAPVVTTSAGSTSYTEGDPATTVDGALTVSDADDTNLEGATVSISTGFQSGDDLVFVNQNGISGVYNTGTGVLTLTGTASVADYQTALRSVQFQTTNDNPSGKTVEFKVNDGSLDSASAFKTINITGQNDGPTINTTATTHNYTEGQGAQPVDPGLTLTDPENDQISGATAQITSNFNQAEDDLVFVDQNGITGSYDDSTGKLTLSGTASVADYQTALRSVAYQNTSDDPTNTTRTVSFQATDAGTPNQASNVATRDVSVADANDAPVVNTSNGSTAYTEGASAATVDNALTVSDADDTNLEGAQVRISSGFQSGDDLVFVNQNGISGVYNTGSGVLTLSGTASKADYQTALRSVQFQTTHDSPVGSKTIEFKVNDGDADSNLATKEVTVTPGNDAPTLNTSAGNATFTEDLTGPVAVDPNLTLSDPDSTNIQGATAEITTGFNSSEDQLVFVDTATITGTYNSGTGVLTLSGTDTVANYQAALRSVQYNNTDTVAPDTTQRTVRFQATDDGGAPSNFASRNVTINSVNDAPVVSTTGGSTPYTEDDPATTIDGGLTVTDQDDTNLEGGQVRISNGFQSGDDLVFVNQNGISGVYNSGTGVLTLSGTASVANYQTALRSIQFQSTHQQPVTSKTIEFKVNDGDADSNLATKELAVTPTNDAPVVNATDAALSYTENDPATAVDPGLTIDDTENDNLSGGSASITANYQAGQDFLAWTDNSLADNITLDAINSNAQTVVLTGVDSEANYQAALRAVTYQNGSEAPTNVARTVTFSATDQPGLTGSDTRTINVTPVDDPPDAVNDSATVLEDAAATSIPVLTNDTDIDGGPKTISSATDPANGTVVPTGGSPGAYTGLTYQPDPNYCNDPPGSAPDTFQYTVNGGDTAFVSMTVTCVNDAPVADDETFNGANSAIGNTTHVVNDPSDGAPVPGDPTDTGAREDRPHKAITGDILAGDTDVDGPGPLTVTPGTFATNDGGSVTIESDGDFTFEPAAATSCTDTSDFFDYTVEDSDPGDERTDTGRVTIAITDCVWYVNNHDAQSNSGTSAAPFDSIAQAATASGAGHHIYVYEGNGTSLQYPGIALKQNQSLIGEAADLVVAGTTLQEGDQARRPQLSEVAADVVALDDANTVTGLELDPTGAFSGIAGGPGDTGGGTIADVRIIDTGVAATNAGLELLSTTGTFNVSDLTVNNVAALGQNGSSKGVELSSAGTVNFVPTGTISITTTGGAGLDATSTNLGTSTFDTITTSNSSTGGVVLTNTTNPVGGSTTFGDLNLTTTSGSTAAFRVSSGGTISVPSGGSDNVHATGGPAIDVTSTTGPTLSFDDVDSTNSASDGINLDGLGTGTFSATSGDIGGAAGISFDLNGGSGAITYPGNLNNGSGQAAEITGRSGGVVSLSGPISDTNDAGGGIVVSSNTGGSTVFSGATKQINTTTSAGANNTANNAIVFSASDGHTLVFSGGGLDIDTGSGTPGRGLQADTSGTIQVSGSGNTVDTTVGRAVDISDTDIAAADVTFQRVRSDGAATGIRLNNTGNAGNMAVTGAGGTCTNADTSGCSGGEIENGTGADSASVTPDGTGIVLNNTVEPSFTRMWIHDHSNYGIRGTSVSGFTLTNSVLNGTNGTNDAGTFQDSSVLFENASGPALTGSASVTNNHFSGGYANNFRVRNQAGTLNRLTFSNNTVGANSTVGGNDGVHVQGQGTATVNVTLNNNALTSARGDVFQMISEGSGGGDLDYSGNAVSNNHPAIATGGGGVTLSGGDDTGSTFDFDIDDSVGNNTFRDAKASAITVVKSDGGGVLDGLISGADIGVTGTANSGSLEGSGIEVTHGGSTTGGNPTSNVSIVNNTIRQYNTFGISLVAGLGGGTASGVWNLNVTGNSVSTPGNNAAIDGFQGIALNNGTAPGDNFQTCFNLKSNSVVGSGVDGSNDIRVRTRFNGNVRLPGYGGSLTDTTAIAAFLANQNDANPNDPAANPPVPTASAAIGNPPTSTFTGTGTTCP
ncbi:MAG TPA: tandem-95 repeat protein [Thermoleophilaceae bacterium]